MVAEGQGLHDSRRSNKPIMEKRRRARINHCLNELKALILSSGEKDSCRHSKLEKADILEMTVGHVERLQRTDRFQEGWRQCLGEVAGFAGLHPQVKKNLLKHLSSRMMKSTSDGLDQVDDSQTSRPVCGEAGQTTPSPVPGTHHGTQASADTGHKPLGPAPWSPVKLPLPSQEHWRPW